MKKEQQGDTLHDYIQRTLSCLFLYCLLFSPDMLIELLRRHFLLMPCGVKMEEDKEKNVFTLTIDFGDIQLEYTLHYQIKAETNAYYIYRID